MKKIFLVLIIFSIQVCFSQDEQETFLTEYNSLVIEELNNYLDVEDELEIILLRFKTLIGNKELKFFFREDFDAFCTCEKCSQAYRDSFTLEHYSSQGNEMFSISFLDLENQEIWNSFIILRNEKTGNFFTYFEKKVFINNYFIKDFISMAELEKQKPGVLVPLPVNSLDKVTLIKKIFDSYAVKAYSDEYATN